MFSLFIISTTYTSVHALEMTSATMTLSQNDVPITISGQHGAITSEKNCGDLKEDFIIHGTIHMPLSNSPVQIRIYYPNGTIYDSERIPTQQISSDGSYSYLFSMIYDNKPAGPYSVAVYYNGYSSAKTSFYLVVPPIERGPPPDTLRIVDNKGHDISKVNVGQQVQIADSVLPMCGNPNFVYLLQVQDPNQITISLSWVGGLVEQGQPMNFSETWMPLTSGNYTIQRYLWSSIDNPNALSPSISKTVEVR